MPFSCLSPRLQQLYLDAGQPGHVQVQSTWTRLRGAGLAPLRDVPALSEDSLRKYLGGHYDQNVTKANQVEGTFRAIEAVLHAIVAERPAGRYRALDDTLRRHRLTLTVLMNLYYGANPPADGADGIGEYTLPRHDGTATAMLSHVVDGAPVMLLTPGAWIPPRPLPLVQVDQGLVMCHDLAEPAPLAPGLADAVVRHLGKRCDDDRSYRAVAIENDHGRLRMSFARSSYHAFYEGCEALTWEAAGLYHDRLRDSALGRHEGEALADYAARLTAGVGRAGLQRRLREWVDQSAPLRRAVDPLRLDNRSVGAGVNTLLVLCRRGRAPMFRLHQRGKGTGPDGAPIKLAEGSGTLHVVPAGTFQPVHGQWLPGAGERDVEFSLARNVLREFCEEVLFCDDQQTRRLYRGWENMIRALYLPSDPDQVFEEHETLRRTKAFFDAGRARQFFLGGALDLVSTKLEILTVLLLDWDEFEERHLRLTNDNPEGRLEDLREFSPGGLSEALREELLQPAGAGCLAMSLRHFDALTREIDALLADG